MDEKISDPSSAVLIQTGQKINGELTVTDTHLPDNTPADYYCIELKGDKPAIKFSSAKDEKINIKGYVYQDKMFISQLTETGVKLKPGRAIILIDAGNKTGRYSFKIEELSETEKSALR